MKFKSILFSALLLTLLSNSAQAIEPIFFKENAGRIGIEWRASPFKTSYFVVEKHYGGFGAMRLREVTEKELQQFLESGDAGGEYRLLWITGGQWAVAEIVLGEPAEIARMYRNQEIGHYEELKFEILKPGDLEYGVYRKLFVGELRRSKYIAIAKYLGIPAIVIVLLFLLLKSRGTNQATQELITQVEEPRRLTLGPDYAET